MTDPNSVDSNCLWAWSARRQARKTSVLPLGQTCLQRDLNMKHLQKNKLLFGLPPLARNRHLLCLDCVGDHWLCRRFLKGTRLCKTHRLGIPAISYPDRCGCCTFSQNNSFVGLINFSKSTRHSNVEDTCLSFGNF